jgi:hypothetical protein
MWNDFLTNEQLPVHKWTHYIPIYEQFLSRYKSRTCTILEIGCSKGGSLQMWKRFLGPYAAIIGIDIEPTCKTIEEEQIKIEIGSQSDKKFLDEIIHLYGPFDAVIDDGSHTMSDIMTSFKTLFDHVTPDGIYIVEDLHTAYWSEYGGGLHNANSFVEFTKKIIDAIHAPYIKEEVAFESFVQQVAELTRSITMADSIIVYEKGRKIRKHAPLIGRSDPISNIISELTF